MTVVLEAGLTASASQWTTILPRLAETTRVVAVSRAGYGGSTPVGRRSAHESVADLAAVLEEVEGPLVLVGHSWGGMLCRLYAARRPERVHGLVVVDATHEALDAMRTRSTWVLGQLGMRAVERSARSGRLRRQVEAGEGKLARTLAKAPDHARDVLVAEMTSPGVWAQAARDYSAIAPALRELHERPLPTPTVPVVALVGALGPGREAKARATVIAVYERWVSTLPEGRLVMAPRSGHMVTLDDEDLTVQMVQELVAEVSRSSASTTERRRL